MYHKVGEEIRLELIGTFIEYDEGSILSIFQAKMEDVIHGQASDGRAITLFDCSCRITHSGQAIFSTAIYNLRIASNKISLLKNPSKVELYRIITAYQTDPHSLAEIESMKKLVRLLRQLGNSKKLVDRSNIFGIASALEKCYEPNTNSDESV